MNGGFTTLTDRLMANVPSLDSYVPSPERIREAFAGASPDEVVFVARSYLESGAWDHVLALCDALEPLDTPGVRLCRAVAQFVSGDVARALAAVEELLDARPTLLAARYVRAQMLARKGERQAAVRALVDLARAYPDYPGALGLLASLLMPGPPYREVLARIHERLRPRSYLEIGVDTGATLALARYSEHAVGVDPAERPLVPHLPPGAQVFREESQTFFERDRKQIFGSRRVDLGFVDGMHRFENALADFANLERWAHADATIVLHDCVPIDPVAASRDRETKFWVGDTWKVVFALARYRPELKIRTLLTPPSGLVVIRRLNPGNDSLLQHFAEIVESLRELSWTWKPDAFPSELGAVQNDERGLAEALA